MNPAIPDSGTLASVASVIAAFGAAMLFFRVQREISMRDHGERNWIPWADWLLVVATVISLLLVILPLVALDPTNRVFKAVPAAACGATAILVAGYPFAILAHYRFILAADRRGARSNPEPPERWLVGATAVLALAVFCWLSWRRWL